MSRNIPLASRDFYIDQNGLDTNDGKSIESPLTDRDWETRESF